MDGSSSEITADKFFRGTKMAGDYKKLRPEYPPELSQYIMEFLNKKPGPNNLSVDVGCGSGQSTIMMSQYFNHVLGVDLSPDQIKYAKDRTAPPNVHFKVGHCGDIPVESGTVDLVTAGTCIHWFDLKQFLPEVDRLLRPGGCLAIYSYLETDIECDDPDKTAELKQILRKVDDYILENNRPEEWVVPWDVIKSHFTSLELPYADSLRGVTFNIKQPSTIATFMELMKTYSECKEFKRKDPEAYSVTFERLTNDLMSVFGNESSPEETHITCVLPVFMALCRKPNNNEE